jgi:simple sugar transport system permease protein
MTDTKTRQHAARRSRLDDELRAQLKAPALQLSGRSGLSGYFGSLGRSSRTVTAKIISFAVTIVVALIAALPIVYLSGSNGQIALQALIGGSWGSPQAVAETLVQTIPLLIAGLAVALAFHGGLFNIGVEGQLIIGALAAGIVGATVHLPGPLLLLAALAAGMVAGALWALIPALLKAFRGVHEVVTTIMMNYIAINISAYAVTTDGPFASKTQPSATEKVPLDAHLAVIAPGTRLHAGLFIAIALIVVLMWVLYRTPAGFRLRLLGANPHAASAAGVSLKRTTVTVMLASGAIAGLAGAVQVLGVYGRYFDGFSPGYGYSAIAVALLGALSPVGIAAAALFFGTLDAGAVQLQAVAGISREMVSVVSGLVVAFVAAQPAIFRLLHHLQRTLLADWSSRRAAPPVLPPPINGDNDLISAGLDNKEGL